MGIQCRQSGEAGEQGKEEKTQGQLGLTPHRRATQHDTMEKLVEAGSARRPRQTWIGQTRIGQRRSPADLAGR